MIGTATGFLVFLLLMFVAVQVLFNLYATSMVTTAAHDAARSVAYFGSSADRCAAVRAAQAAMEDSLGDYAKAGHVTTSWTCSDPNSVSVRVVATHPTILPPRMAGILSLGHLDRTIRVRVEEFR